MFVVAKITKIEVQKNNNQKANLFLDEVFFSRIYLDTCVKYGLKSGLEIEENKLKQIIDESEKKLAVNFAVNYIGSAIKTRKQIRDYLKKKEFDAESIEYVVSKLEEYKYIDDEAYVASYVNFYSSKYGKNKIINNLKAKGVSEKIIANFFEDNGEDFAENAQNLCMEIAKKKARNLDLSDVKNVQKLSRFLIGRGFDYDEINYTINKLKSDTKWQ